MFSGLAHPPVCGETNNYVSLCGEREREKEGCAIIATTFKVREKYHSSSSKERERRDFEKIERKDRETMFPSERPRIEGSGYNNRNVSLIRWIDGTIRQTRGEKFGE